MALLSGSGWHTAHESPPDSFSGSVSVSAELDKPYEPYKPYKAIIKAQPPQPFHIYLELDIQTWPLTSCGNRGQLCGSVWLTRQLLALGSWREVVPYPSAWTITPKRLDYI